MSELFYVDGEIVGSDEARVPVMDRGFLFGDSIYEVVRTFAGRFLAVERHLRRLRGSAERLALEVPWSDAELIEAMRETVERAGNAESYVRIIVTRGSGSAPNIDLAYAEGPPRLVLIVRPLFVFPETAWTQGLSAVLVATRRNDRRSLDPAIKSGNYLNNILGSMEAKAKGADVALFLNPQGKLTEAPTSNVWLVAEGRILTPPLDAGILAGITREMLLEIGADEGLDMAEAELGEADLRSADELFLSSTLKDVMPLTSLDGQPVGDGKPGRLTLDLLERYRARL